MIGGREGSIVGYIVERKLREHESEKKAVVSGLRECRKCKMFY